MLINFSASITAAEPEGRTVSGQIVPFGGEVGNTSSGAVTFEAGSFVELDPSKVKLLMEHDRTRPVGRAISFSVTESGIDGVFSVAETTAGNDLLVEASQGLRDGFSVGANVLDYRYEKNVMVVTAAELIEVSAVTYPAFASAQISEVAASESSEEVIPSEVGEEVDIETTIAEVVEEVAVVEASATPIYTKARVKPLTQGEVVAHAAYAAAGNADSRRLLVEAAEDSTANNTGFTLSKGLPTFVSNSNGSRPAIDAIGGARTLPSTGLTYTIPNLTQAPVVGEIAELDPVTETALESDYLTLDVVKLAGMNTVSFELLDRSDPSFGDILLNEMQKAYAKKTDQYVLAELLNGSNATNQAASWEGLQAFIAKEAPTAYNATGGDIADRLIASSAWWSELLGAKDTTDRPIFTALQPSNAGGVAGIGSARGEVFGASVYFDHNISTVGLIDNSAFLVAPAAVWVAESPTVQLRTNVLSNGSVELELYGYISAKVLKPSGVRKFQIA